jgi:VanZ family protein
MCLQTADTRRGIVEEMRWLCVAWLTAWALFSLPWASATATPHWERVRPPRVRAASHIRLDHVLNVLFYVPLAPLGAGLGYPLLGSVMSGAVMSVTAETVQLFSTKRAPDGNDLIANLGGTVAGAIAVALYRRRHSASP